MEIIWKELCEREVRTYFSDYIKRGARQGCGIIYIVLSLKNIPPIDWFWTQWNHKGVRKPVRIYFHWHHNKVQTYLVWRHHGHSDVRIDSSCQKHEHHQKSPKSWFFTIFFKQKFNLFANDVCRNMLIHVLTPNKSNKMKHSESVSWKQKTRFVCNYFWKSVFKLSAQP